ncbi:MULTISPECIES: hypothetical protein [Micrococcaceae]|uniref:hypothetical protein n=1 Tax=Micrococcaceae TaxID=1268 RepID=UPI0012DC1B76|nr:MULTISPECIES: hypothetical protein [Micrococcaceae]
MNFAQTQEELQTHLAEQIDFLRSACAEFDQGKPAYAKFAATTLRVLLYDGGRGRSLLRQLGLKDRIAFLDTAAQMPEENLATSTNLTVQRMTVIDDEGHVAPSHIPVLDDYGFRTGFNRKTAFGNTREPAAGRRLQFEEWWSMPVIRDDRRHDFSRADLVLALCHKDGGAHINATVDEAYHRLSRSNSLGFVVVGAGEETPFGSPVPASVRQIAHEFLRSIPRGWAG